MAIKPHCDHHLCQKEFSQLGGLFLYKLPHHPTCDCKLDRYQKRHLCIDRGCYQLIRESLPQLSDPEVCGQCRGKLVGRKSCLISPPDDTSEVEVIYFCDGCARRLDETIAGYATVDHHKERERK